MSFAAESTQSVGLGYSKAAAGLMERPPRSPSTPILSRGLMTWLVFVGLVMATGTLGVVSWAEQAHGLAVARTMGMVTLALFNLFFSIEVIDERTSAFSVDTFADRAFLNSTALSVVLLLLSTVLGIFHKVLKTTGLDLGQWLLCTAVALSIVAVAEIRKAVRRRIAATAVPAVRPVPPANASQSRPGKPAGAALGSEHAARRGESDHRGSTADG